MTARSTRDGRSYREHLRTLGIDATQLDTDRTGVLGRGAQHPGVSVDLLPPLRVEGSGPEPGALADLRLGEPIGEGGMGVVVDALQVPLRRRVAVKRLRASATDPEEQAQLLQEALVLGALEHPNVVPVHTLGRGPDGRALLVMKRISGSRWSDVLQPLYPPSANAASDGIDKHLRILMQVCNAVHFAHVKGVVHRDLKPDNVMIGSFGEVYVLDWGIAAATREGAPGDLPLAASVPSVIGTPAYMAPEMAAAAVELIDARTDVYLLGAVLHQLVTGRAPHEQRTLLESLEHAFLSPPPAFDPAVPRELAAVCRRAMSVDPEERFASAEALRDAIGEFLAHRASLQVAAEAGERLAELRRGAGSPAATVLGTEARFGFHQALRAWPGNDEARAGLQQLLELMIGEELGRDDVEAAAALVAELPEPRPALEQRLERTRERVMKRSKRVAALERFHRAADPRLDAPYRNRMLVVIALVLSVPIMLLATLRALGLHRAGYLEALGIALLAAITILWYANDLRKRRINEFTMRLQWSALGMVVMSGATILVCMLFAVDLSVALSMILLVNAMAMMAMGAFVDPKYYRCVPPLCLAAVAIPLWPAWRGLSTALGLGVSVGLASRIWRRG